MHRETVGANLAQSLYAAETSLDRSLEAVARFAALLPAARADAYLSATTGQKAFEGAAGALACITEARAQLIQSHQTLAALARRLGLETLAAGPIDKPDDASRRLGCKECGRSGRVRAKGEQIPT